MQWIDFEALIFDSGAVQDGNFNITKSIANSHDLFPLNVPISSMLLFRQSLFVDVTAISTVDYSHTHTHNSFTSRSRVLAIGTATTNHYLVLAFHSQ
jgi:hypothetical protein